MTRRLHLGHNTVAVIILTAMLITGCGGGAAPSSAVSPAPSATVASGLPAATPSPLATATRATPAVSPSPASTATSRPSPAATRGTAPASYTSRVLVSGAGRPDDLAFDQQGNLLFSDEIDGRISRLNQDGSVTILLSDPSGPEGMVVRPDGTIIFAEQITNRIMSLAPGSTTPTVLRKLPGTHSDASCKQGVDGIAFDPGTNTLIVPDSPTGTVYRMSLDGQTFTELATGIVRPVGAAVDDQGNVYIAEECGGSVVRVAPDGTIKRYGGFGMPDDVVPDGYGNLLVIDLNGPTHALIRLNLTTGARTTLASQGFIEPQGLALDAQGNIFVADDYANVIMEFSPSSP